MTGQANESEAYEARQLLKHSQVLMLDFDGPICSVFAGIPARHVADQLRSTLAGTTNKYFPRDIANTGDPFDIFSYAATLGRHEAQLAEETLRISEVEAVTTAIPTPGSHELIRSWNTAGKRTAIVSNNSETAVKAYLDRHSLTHEIAIISARTFSDPELLKPSTHLITQALNFFDIPAVQCVLIGDSSSDLISARNLNMPSIGYANKENKRTQFAELGVRAVINSMMEIYPLSS